MGRYVKSHRGPAAGLDPEVCVFWNAVPWVIRRSGKKNPPANDAEIARGAEYLRELVDIVKPAAVVAMGKPARKACEAASVEFIATKQHPMIFTNKTLEQDFLAPLREAARRAESGQG